MCVSGTPVWNFNIKIIVNYLFKIWISFNQDYIPIDLCKTYLNKLQVVNEFLVCRLSLRQSSKWADLLHSQLCPATSASWKNSRPGRRAWAMAPSAGDWKTTPTWPSPTGQAWSSGPLAPTLKTACFPSRFSVAQSIQMSLPIFGLWIASACREWTVRRAWWTGGKWASWRAGSEVTPSRWHCRNSEDSWPKKKIWSLLSLQREHVISLILDNFHEALHECFFNTYNSLVLEIFKTNVQHCETFSLTLLLDLNIL